MLPHGVTFWTDFCSAGTQTWAFVSAASHNHSQLSPRHLSAPWPFRRCRCGCAISATNFIILKMRPNLSEYQRDFLANAIKCITVIKIII